MRDKLVKTFDGKDILRSKCMRQKGAYYIVGKDIIKVPKQEGFEWLEFGDYNLLFNIDTGEYVHRELRSKFIIADIDKILTSDVFDCNNVECYIADEYGLATREYADKNLKIDNDTGIYNEGLGRTGSIGGSAFYDTLQYSYEKNTKFFVNFKEKPGIKELDNMSLGYTFGAELETSSGTVPSNELLERGIAPVRDGSLHQIMNMLQFL